MSSPTVPKPPLERRKSSRKGSKMKIPTELASVHRSIQDERKSLYAKGSDSMLRGYALLELDAVENDLVLAIQEKENMLDTLTREIQVQMNVNNEQENDLETRLQARLDYFVKRLEAQRSEELVKTDKFVMSLRNIEITLQRVEREEALYRQQLTERLQPKSTHSMLAPSTEVMTPILEVADFTSAPRSTPPLVWEVAESLRAFTCPHDCTMWEATIIRSLLVDTRMMATRHANFMPWETTVPLYLYTYEYSRECLWAEKTNDTWALISNMKEMEEAYNSAGDFTVNDVVFREEHKAHGIQWFKGVQPDGTAWLVRYSKPKVASRDIYSDPLCSTTLWMCNDSPECLVPPSILEYVYSRPSDEIVGFSDAPEGHKWSAIPYEHKGARWVLDSCKGSKTPDRESVQLAKSVKDAVLKGEPATAVSITCEKLSNIAGSVEITLNAALETMSMNLGEAVNVMLPYDSTHAEHPLSFVRSCSEGQGVSAVDEAFSLLNVEHPSVVIAMTSKLFTVEEVQEHLRTLSSSLVVHCITSDDGLAGLGTIFSDNGLQHSGIALLALKDTGAQAGTFLTYPKASKDIVPAVKAAAANAGWTPAAPPPMFTLITAPLTMSYTDATDAILTVFGKRHTTIVTTGHSNYLQVTVVWLSYPVEVSHHLLSSFRPIEVQGFITSCEEGYILSINGKPAAEEYNRWCGGSLKDLIEEGKEKGIMKQFTEKVACLQYLETEVEVEVAGSIIHKKMCILPQGVTPKGALKVTERVVEGNVRCCVVGDAGPAVQEAVFGSSLQRSEVKAAMLYVPSQMSFDEQQVESLVAALQGELPTVPVIGCFTSERSGSYMRGGSVMSSALPLLMLIGVPPPSQKELPTPPKIDISLSSQRVFIGRSQLTLTPGMLAAPHRYEIPIQTNKKSHTRPPTHQPTMTLFLESKLDHEHSIDPQILAAMFRKKGIVSRGGISPNGARDFLSLQILSWQAVKKTYLLSLTGEVPLMVDLTQPLPELRYSLLDDKNKEDHTCGACGLRSLHVMPDGFLPSPMLCASCAFERLVIRLTRIVNPCTYQLSTIVEHALSSKGTRRETDLPIVQVRDKKYLLNETEHNGVWPLSYNGKPLADGRVNLFGWPLDMVGPFIVSLDVALRRGEPRGVSRLSFRTIKSEDVGTGYREGGVFRWSGFSEARRSCNASENPNEAKVFSIRTTSTVRSISQWSRLPRDMPFLSPIDTCYVVNKVDADGHHIEEITEARALSVVRKTILLEGKYYTAEDLVALL